MNGLGDTEWAWRDADVVRVGLVLLLGLVAIVGAWFGASGTTSLTQQAMWLNVAVAGLVISSAGVGLWLMRGRQAVGRRRRSLVALEVAEPEQALPPHAMPATEHASTTIPELWAVRVPGGRRVHDPACPLVAGKAVEPVAAGSGDPCGVCAP